MLHRAGVSALPDGSIIVTGGDSDNRTSIYNPATNSWAKGAGLNIPRGYQVLLLLPHDLLAAPLLLDFHLLLVQSWCGSGLPSSVWARLQLGSANRPRAGPPTISRAFCLHLG